MVAAAAAVVAPQAQPQAQVAAPVAPEVAPAAAAAEKVQGQEPTDQAVEHATGALSVPKGASISGGAVELRSSEEVPMQLMVGGSRAQAVAPVVGSAAMMPEAARRFQMPPTPAVKVEQPTGAAGATPLQWEQSRPLLPAWRIDEAVATPSRMSRLASAGRFVDSEDVSWESACEERDRVIEDVVSCPWLANAQPEEVCPVSLVCGKS